MRKISTVQAFGSGTETSDLASKPSFIGRGDDFNCPVSANVYRELIQSFARFESVF
jgi:hypothetical protein